MPRCAGRGAAWEGVGKKVVLPLPVVPPPPLYKSGRVGLTGVAGMDLLVGGARVLHKRGCVRVRTKSAERGRSLLKLEKEKKGVSVSVGRFPDSHDQAQKSTNWYCEAE